MSKCFIIYKKLKENETVEDCFNKFKNDKENLNIIDYINYNKEKLTNVIKENCRKDYGPVFIYLHDEDIDEFELSLSFIFRKLNIDAYAEQVGVYES